MFGRVKLSHCNTLVMQISREGDLKCFILFLNVFTTCYSSLFYSPLHSLISNVNKAKNMLDILMKR